MKTKWKQVWNQRKEYREDLEKLDQEEMVLYLKELDGFDSVKEKTGLTYEAIVKQYERTKLCLAPQGEIGSVYEVGCGSGANLYLFEREGIKTGGIDYSKNLIRVAEKVLASGELLCEEAINLPTDIVYDSVLSNSVFSYFPDFDYAEAVLEKMLDKCRYSMGILDIHDANRKEAFLSCRRSLIENYDEKYDGLHKLFYPKTFFIEFAEKHTLDVKFSFSDLDGYWNNEFIFNCFFYKRRLAA